SSALGPAVVLPEHLFGEEPCESSSEKMFVFKELVLVYEVGSSDEPAVMQLDDVRIPEIPERILTPLATVSEAY
ncbi:hypothetical protein STEG23_033216, partial [Scotinomys teguina]